MDGAEPYRRYALLALLPVAVAIFGEVLLKAFVPVGPEFLNAFATSATAALQATEISARLKILALFLLVTGIAVGIVIKFTLDYFLLDPAQKNAVLQGGAICVAAAAFIVFGTWAGILSRSIELLGSGTFAAASKLVELSADNVPSMSTILAILIVIATLTLAAAIAALIAGSISCLLFSNEESADVWKSQFSRFKQYSYAAAALLVVGVLFFQSWAHWPIFAFSPACSAPGGTGAAACAYESRASAMTLFAGVQFSLLLLSYCLPVAAILDRKADEIAAAKLEANPKETTIEKYRADNGLTITMADQIKAPLVFFAPMLAGSLDNIANIITGK